MAYGEFEIRGFTSKPEDSKIYLMVIIMINLVLWQKLKHQMKILTLALFM